MNLLRIAVCAAALCACSFDQTGVAPLDGAATDGRANDAPGADAAPCEQALVARISVNGITEGSPFTRVLIGDTVTLSAAGSCSDSSGPLTYEWQISPIDGTRETAEPTLFAETITVYPVNAEQYTISLTVRDNAGHSNTVQVYGFSAYGWQPLDGLIPSNIRGLAVGPDDLFIAADAGGYRLPLAAPTSGFINLDNESVGDPIATSLGRAHWDSDNQLVWLSATNSADTVWRITRTPPFTATQVDFATSLGGSATVHDLGSIPGGIEIASNRGVAETSNTITFTKTFDGDQYAVARGAGQRWVGGQKLFDIDNSGAQLDPFDTGDNKIRRMLVDVPNNELWLATDNNGIARVVNSNGALLQIYKTAGSNLTDNRVRDIAIETTGPFAGDIWVATGNGISRYKRDRGVWVPMGIAHGLLGRTDVNAIVIDENGGRRRIYAGTTGGLVYSRVE